MNKTFCKLLKELRLAKEMRQIDIAKKLHIASNTISSWERGNSMPDINELMQIARYFEVSTDYLLGLEDEYGNKR
jgi:transcriptional regulator with XRE-family HTH domain